MHHESKYIGSIHVENFICHSKCRAKSNKKGNKPSGGLAVYIHNSIKPGVTFLSRPGSETIWIKLDCDFFNLNRDLYCCFVYAAPRNSPYLRRLNIDIFENLVTETSEFVGQGSLCLLGDFNSRTGSGLDFIPGEVNSDIPAAQSGLYSTDCIGTIQRGNLDKVTNPYGKKLLDLCIDTPLRILNGRKLGDLLGYHTCYQYNGSSAVDYGLVSPDLYDQVPVFSVMIPDLSVSDHAPIVMYLKVNSFVSFANCNENVLPKQKKVNWDAHIKDRFKNLINSEDCESVCSSFLQSGIKPEQTSIDAAVKFLSDIMVETAERADLSIKSAPNLGKPVPRRGGCRVPVKYRPSSQAGIGKTVILHTELCRRQLGSCIKVPIILICLGN